jgi:hypothetical protein
LERGSFTWKVNVDGFHNHTIICTRGKRLLQASGYNPSNNALLTTNSGAARDFMDTIFTNSGAMMLNTRTNDGVSFNAPMYAQTTILDTSPAFRVEGLTNISGTDAVTLNIVTKEEKNGGADHFFPTIWFNVGPDYSPFFFLNVPTLYFYDSFPSSA